MYIFRNYKNRVVKPQDQQLVPVTTPTIEATNFSFAVPQLFGPQYFKNDYTHRDLGKLKKGGIVKGQNGLSGNWGTTHPWVQDLFNQYKIDPNSVYYRDKDQEYVLYVFFWIMTQILLLVHYLP